MKPVNGMNDSEVKYFPLEEYIGNIKLNDGVLFHSEDTCTNFDKYLTRLAQYDDYSIIHFWIQNLGAELKYSTQIENHLINPSDVLKNDAYFDTLHMSHARIKQLHSFLCSLDPNCTLTQSELSDYRQIGKEVRVSKLEGGEEKIFWRGANSEDVKRFMDDFIKAYKTKSLSLLNSNPFLKSALMSLLFVRIHPFVDGNGRTSRMIYNIKFTDMLNQIYNTRLKLCPLNLSQNIALYKPAYVSRINDIYFDLEHDCNDEINRWFDFILTRADETIYYCEGQLPKLEEEMQRADLNRGQYTEDASKMQLKKVRK